MPEEAVRQVVVMTPYEIIATILNKFFCGTLRHWG